MKKIFSLFLILLIFCSKNDINSNYKNLLKSLENFKSNEEKAKLIIQFLKSYPESSYTYDLCIELIEYEKPANSEAFINNLIEKVKDEEIKEELKFCLLELYKKIREKDKIIKTFNSFKKPLKYYHYSETIKALIEIEEFENSLRLTEEMMEFCKKENVFKELENLTEERKLRTYKRRNFEVQFLKGKIFYGLKDFENSFNSFELAKSFLKPSFAGTYLDDFNYHYAILLKDMGKREEAILAILPDVLFERNKKNYELFEKIYSEINGSNEGINDFLNAKKEEISPVAIDFNLKDYYGKEYNFFDISKDKITLLTFWFPT